MIPTPLTSNQLAVILKASIKAQLSTDMGLFMGAGISLLLSFALIILVITGLKMALAREGINWIAFLQPIFQIATALALMKAYNTPMSWLGNQSLLDIIIGGPSYFADKINTNTWQNLQNLFTSYDKAHKGSVWNITLSLFSDPGNVIAGIIVGILTAVLQAALMLVMAWGYVAQMVCTLVGPLFIPFILVKPLSFLFWGWFKTLLTYSFYPVVANLVVAIISSVMVALMTAQPNPLGGFTSLYGSAACIPFLIFGALALFGTPALVNSLFSGHGSDPGMINSGVSAMRLRKGM